jgi:hypothetical protein
VIWAPPASAAMQSPAAARTGKLERTPARGDSASPRAQARGQADSVLPPAQLTPMAGQADSAAPRVQVPPVLELQGSASPGGPVARSDSPLQVAVVQVTGSIRAPQPREGPA